MSNNTTCMEMKRQLNMDILADWLKVGTMLMVSRFLEIQQTGASFQDPRWVQASLFTLLGFTTYHLVTKQVLPLTHPNPQIRTVLETVLKVGTMLVVSRLLARGSVTDQRWLRSTAFTLAGFATYDLVTHRAVPQGLTPAYRETAVDALKFGTMFAVSRALAGGDLTDEQWLRSSLYTIVGFAAYNLVGKQLFANILNMFNKSNVRAGVGELAGTVGSFAGEFVEDVGDLASDVVQDVGGVARTAAGVIPMGLVYGKPRPVGLGVEDEPEEELGHVMEEVGVEEGGMEEETQVSPSSEEVGGSCYAAF